MNKMKVFLLMLLMVGTLPAQRTKLPTNKLEWKMSELMKERQVKIKGAPKLIDTEYGRAVWFNGINDGMFINKMPLKGLKHFTVEIIFRPESGGGFEQRYFHCGEVTGSRVMLELRSVREGWYFDAYLNSFGAKKALIDSTKIHPSDKWYHAAFVVDNGRLTSYVNGTEELCYSISFSPFHKGKTAIGVRQNLVSWYRGAIYKIIITPAVLSPQQFSTH